MFAVVRHPDIDVTGIIPRAAYDLHRARGWYRVSPWRDWPAELHLPDYAESFEDLDAEPKSADTPAKTTKESKA